MNAATPTINTAVRNNMDMNQPNGSMDTGSDYRKTTLPVRAAVSPVWPRFRPFAIFPGIRLP